MAEKTNRINELIKEKNLKINHIVEVSGYTRDYINRIKRGDATPRLNQDNLDRISSAIGCYPSELLPLEWQKPSSTEIDPDVLRGAIENFIQARATFKGEEKQVEPIFTPEEYRSVALEYGNILESKKDSR